MRKILLQILEFIEDDVQGKIGTKAPLSGVWRNGEQYIPLSKGEIFSPSTYSQYWKLVCKL